MEVYVFDKEINALGLIEAYEYLRWTRRYSKCGDFELKAVASESNLALLKVGNIIWKNDDEEAGVIEYLQLQMQETESVVVSGRFATSILDRRIIWGTEVLDDELSMAVGQLIINHIIDPLLPERKIACFDYFALPLGINVRVQISFKSLLPTVEELCGTYDVGLKTVFNPTEHKFTLKLYSKGITSAVFAKEFENILEQTYTESIKDYYNIALVAGEGEGDARIKVTAGEASTGLDRKEIFIDAKDIKSVDWGENYTGALLQRGLSKLAESCKAQSIEASINPHGNLKYKADFDLGDIITVFSRRWGVQMSTRITEIAESYAAEGFNIDVTFGKGVFSLAEKIKSIGG